MDEDVITGGRQLSEMFLSSSSALSSPLPAPRSLRPRAAARSTAAVDEDGQGSSQGGRTAKSGRNAKRTRQADPGMSVPYELPGAQHSIPFHHLPLLPQHHSHYPPPHSYGPLPGYDDYRHHIPPPMSRTLSRESVYSSASQDERERAERELHMQARMHDPGMVLLAPMAGDPSAGPGAAAPKAKASKKKSTSRAKVPLAEPSEPIFLLAPNYTANPAGPASSEATTFQCPKCDKQYKGKHARSIWRRHLQDKHGIPLSAQPRRTRWDTDAKGPKSEEERRARTLASKRRWAKKHRAEKRDGDNSNGEDLSGDDEGTSMEYDASFDSSFESAAANTSMPSASPYDLPPLHERRQEEEEQAHDGRVTLAPMIKQPKAILGVKDPNVSRPSSAAATQKKLPVVPVPPPRSTVREEHEREPAAPSPRRPSQSIAHLLSSPSSSGRAEWSRRRAAPSESGDEGPSGAHRPVQHERQHEAAVEEEHQPKQKRSKASHHPERPPSPPHSQSPAYMGHHAHMHHPYDYSPMAGPPGSSSSASSFNLATPGGPSRSYGYAAYTYGAGYGYYPPPMSVGRGLPPTPYGYAPAGGKADAWHPMSYPPPSAGNPFSSTAKDARYASAYGYGIHPPTPPSFVPMGYANSVQQHHMAGPRASFAFPPPAHSLQSAANPPPRAPGAPSLALPFSSPISRNSLSSYALRDTREGHSTGSSLLSSPAAHHDHGDKPSSGLLSSPAHPELSRQLGLSALPGPGVFDAWPTVGADTPDRNSFGRHKRSSTSDEDARSLPESEPIKEDEDVAEDKAAAVEEGVALEEEVAEAKDAVKDVVSVAATALPTEIAEKAVKEEQVVA